MTMQVYNSLSRSKEELRTIEPGHVKLYTCGPTVYNFAHIGNFRAYTFEDVLRRALLFDGFRVTQVMNLTDVDDKTIRGSLAAGVPLKSFTRPYIQAFFDDLKTLNIQPAEHYPAATDHIPEMIALVAKLFERGLAYTSEDGSVYFSVGKLPGYGKLAHLDRENLRAGARVAQDEYEKESYGDFALWKGWDASDGEVVWESPWGRGRPGWHLECSAMAMRYLGETFDLHTGGIDNLFPHHENEIAQAEGATGKPFVTYWMHCAHLRVNGEKMSKSLGNFFTLRDLVDKGWSGREIRTVLINGHYRQALNFTFDALDAARAALARVDECVDALGERAAGAAPAEGVPVWAAEARDAFAAAVHDDLNMPEAFAALFALVRGSNSALHAGALAASDAAALLALVDRMDSVLGVIRFGRADRAAAVPAEITALAEARAAARAAKDWAGADRLRDELAAKGWEVRDSKEGQKLKKL
ncbi:MAG: cysteine--tRNA ligase [Kiritimatiellia bacterium]|jgi:cysteinyl-tRNA synthetase|nr:cysteine--tRNA ligase [Kiritimatiellia bacterium]MDD4173345.1 cysteine--tRNA ligase [Kiritimatiellia bacterium]MDD4440854.1 cysteine--tRNA ligase [Kiritimatiellia bacterium]MDX9792671.1 cysteine--tRNA ligase [Kiritimatiellia bacterium]NLC81811.1 cysteine--tRNA ligase [Lentisphaerota bacterium]